jgi:hypothetical protein
MKCPICNQSFMPGLTPEHCPACGCPVKKIMDTLGGQGQIKSKTHVKAVDFFKKHVRNAHGWFELKPIGYKHYLYGRLRVDGVKKSIYLGRV